MAHCCQSSVAAVLVDLIQTAREAVQERQNLGAVAPVNRRKVAQVALALAANHSSAGRIARNWVLAANRNWAEPNRSRVGPKQ